MIKKDLLDELSARLKTIVTTNPAHNIEENIRALLSSTFTRLNLVTRDEFDAQSAVLAHTRARFEALEKQVAMLEQKAKGSY
jgi:BMFP domain-containing protein YqiC